MATNEQIQIIIKAMASQAISELDKVNKGLAATEKTTKSAKIGFDDLAMFMSKAAVAAGALYTVYRTLLKPASDLEEQTNKFNVVFREQSEAAESASRILVNSYGLSTRAAKEYMSTLGSMLKSMGMTSQQSVRMSSAMTQLAVDMSSFHNVDTAEVMTAFRSALSGEFEPMKRFGVLLNETTVKAEAMRMGLYRGTGEITAQARAMASWNIITRSQRDAIGDFARTSDGFANQLRIMSANIEDVSAKLGSVLLPMAKSVANMFNNMITGVGRLAGAFESMGGVMAGVGTVVMAYWRGILAVATVGISELLNRIGDAERRANSVRGMWTRESGSLGNIAGMGGRGITSAFARPAPIASGGGGQSAAAKAAQEREKIEQQWRDKFVDLRNQMAAADGDLVAKMEGNYTRDLQNAMRHGANLSDIHRFYALERDRLEEEMFQKNMERYSTAAANIGSMWSQVGTVAGLYFKGQSMSLDKWYKDNKKKIDNSQKDEETKKAELAALEEQYQKKQRDIAIKQAKFEKANAIISATINTFQAATKALAQGGFFGGPVMAGIITALGLAQVALIAKQPIPEAAEGGLITGSQAGTLIRAGEGGRSEAIIPLENSAAMEKMGGLGSTIVNIHFDRMWAATSMPQEVASAVDKALYDLKRRGNSRFATAIEG